MKRLIILLLGTGFLISCGNSTTNEQVTTESIEWYSGGDLHKKTIGDWKSATKENRLATCADFMAITMKDKSVNELKIPSNELMDCINEATRGLPETDYQKVSEIATLCVLTLGYNQ